LRLPLAVLAAAITLFACERSQDRATETVVEKLIASKGRESKVEIDREHGEIRVTLGGAIKPAGWPSAVPIYPHAEHAKVRKSDQTETGGGSGAPPDRLSVVTADSVGELRQYYRDVLIHDGWSLGSDAVGGEALRARRGDEDVSIVFAARGMGRGSEAQIEYRKGADPAGSAERGALDPDGHRKSAAATRRAPTREHQDRIVSRTGGAWRHT
jgi:hypothetical protein